MRGQIHRTEVRVKLGWDADIWEWHNSRAVRRTNKRVSSRARRRLDSMLAKAESLPRPAR